MVGSWNGGYRFSNALDAGTITSGDTNGASDSDSGTAYVKGTWTTVIAALGNDCTWVMIQVFSQTGISWYSSDIGIGGAGNAVSTILINNLATPNQAPIATTLIIPLAIKSGTRIAVRSSSNFTFDGPSVRLTCFPDTFGNAGGCSGVDTYGFNTANNTGVAVDPGAVANTNGSWVQLTASLTNDISGFFISFDAQHNNSTANVIATYLIDIGIGSAGSEVQILPNIQQISEMATPTSYGLDVTPYFPIPIRAGTRVAIRAQCSDATSPDRIIGATFYGVRQ